MTYAKQGRIALLMSRKRQGVLVIYAQKAALSQVLQLTTGGSVKRYEES
jgi:hypothetical protein